MFSGTTLVSPGTPLTIVRDVAAMSAILGLVVLLATAAAQLIPPFTNHKIATVRPHIIGQTIVSHIPLAASHPMPTIKAA